MKKRLLSLVLTIAMAASLPAAVANISPRVLAADGGAVIVQCAKAVVSAGESVDVVISADGVEKMAGYLIYIRCDTEIFQAVLDEEDGTVLVRRGDLTDSGTLMGNAYGSVGWQVLWFAPENISGSGGLFTISLIVDEAAASGEYEIGISYSPENTVDVDGNPCELHVTGATIQVVGADTSLDEPEEGGKAPEVPGKEENPEGGEPESEAGDEANAEDDAASDAASPDGEEAPGEMEQQPSVSATEDFLDVEKTHWAYSYIMTLAGRNIVSGAGDGRFYPDRQVTRAEFVKMLAGVAGADVQGRSTERFEDVKEGQWWTPYIAWASEEGLVNGISETAFGPDQLLTREQMATLIHRFCTKLGIELPDTQTVIVFADGDDISDYAKQAVESVQAAGIINGYENGTFCPKANTKRSEAAKVLASVLVPADAGRG